MAAKKAWKFGDAKAPAFPDDFTIVRKAVLQLTDVVTNHNKYYALELHQGEGNAYRLFTHYGRTDDLETNPEDAGQKECRFFDSLEEAQLAYDKIYREKTNPKKGYIEVALASSNIGSHKARGTSAGHVDERTLEKVAAPMVTAKSASLHDEVQSLVGYIYQEATQALTKTVAVTITANGIETPLGILTLGQIEKGEKILEDLQEAFGDGSGDAKAVEDLSSDFYSAIPHRIGRTKAKVAAAVINSPAQFLQKQETLQLMKDMLQINGAGSVLFDAKVDQEYRALGCEIEWVPHDSPEFAEIRDYLKTTQIQSGEYRVKNLWKLKRPSEWEGFAAQVGNDRHLFHGSRISNWVGILSRGILMPKAVTQLGVNRTDIGFLGSGIYFGGAVCKSYSYCTPGKRKTALLGVARVALGNVKQFDKITHGLKAPPKGYDSCHGVRGTEFKDDEFVVYTPRQQRLEYLVEMTHHEGA